MSRSKKNALKAVAIAIAVIILVPIVKLVAAFALTFVMGVIAMIAAAPLVALPVILIFGLLALIDYAIVKGLIRIFRR